MSAIFFHCLVTTENRPLSFRFLFLPLITLYKICSVRVFIYQFPQGIRYNFRNILIFNKKIKQYKKLIGLDNVELEITEDAISAVARKAITLKTGARGLRTILENLMIDTMYDLPSERDVQKVIVDAGVVEQGNKPKIVKKDIA